MRWLECLALLRIGFKVRAFDEVYAIRNGGKHNPQALHFGNR